MTPPVKPSSPNSVSPDAHASGTPPIQKRDGDRRDSTAPNASGREQRVGERRGGADAAPTPVFRPLPKESRVQETKTAKAKALDWEKSVSASMAILGVPFLAHVLYTLRQSTDALPVAFTSYVQQVVVPTLASPINDLLLLGMGGCVLAAVHGFRHRNDGPGVPLPPYPPEPDLRFDDGLILGHGYTWDGLQPGDVVGPEDEILPDPHLIWEAKGQFGNGHITGGVGGGKTEACIKPVLYQLITKWPKPELPEHLSPGGATVTAGEASAAQSKSAQWAKLGEKFSALLGQQKPGLSSDIYRGMSEHEAEAEFARLMALHERKKCGLFMLDPKGDLADFVLQAATLAGRQDDVVILRPGGKWSYNPLSVSDKPLTMAEFVMDGVSAVAQGSVGPEYYRSVQSEFLTNALHILKAVAPTKVTFVELLNMARDEQLRSRYVGEAAEILEEASHEQARLGSLGQRYTGRTVDPNAVAFFKDFDDEEADPQVKRSVVSGLKAYFKYYVEGELRGFLNPELPPTFKGFSHCFTKGKLVVLHMPFDTFGPVGRVLGILMLADFQQAAKSRFNRPDWNQDRIVYLIGDEFSNYLNEQTKKFISVNRQSRVCCIFAHQSMGQLVQGSDRGFFDAVNDNLRTKIVFQVPNAIAGVEISRILGNRDMIKRTLTDSRSLKDLSAKPGESMGESISYQDVLQPWFASHDLLKLEAGEAVIMAFDGNRNVLPRKVVSQMFYRQHGEALDPFKDIVMTEEDPHPVLVLNTTTRDVDFLKSFLEDNKFFLVHPLYDTEGRLGGIRVSGNTGTMMISYAVLIEQRELIEGYLAADSSSYVKVGLMDPGPSLGLFWHVLRMPIPSPVFLGAAWANIHGEPVRSAWDVLAEQTGTARAWPETGSWEALTDQIESNREVIASESRRMLDLYRQMVSSALARGDGEFDLMLDTFAREARAAAAAAEADIEAATRDLVDADDQMLAAVSMRAVRFSPRGRLEDDDPEPDSPPGAPPGGPTSGSGPSSAGPSSDGPNSPSAPAMDAPPVTFAPASPAPAGEAAQWMLSHPLRPGPVPDAAVILPRVAREIEPMEQAPVALPCEDSEPVERRPSPGPAVSVTPPHSGEDGGTTPAPSDLPAPSQFLTPDATENHSDAPDAAAALHDTTSADAPAVSPTADVRGDRGGAGPTDAPGHPPVDGAVLDPVELATGSSPAPAESSAGTTALPPAPPREAPGGAGAGRGHSLDALDDVISLENG